MGTPIRVLVVEDSEDDTLLIVRELTSAGYEVKYQRVDSPRSLSLACDSGEWDLVISDFSMPHFSGTDALRYVRSRHMEIPFIFVSGTMGEDTAVTAMRNGAQDYLVKGYLRRLAPAVQRELSEHEHRKERKRLERHVQQLQKFEAIGRLSGGIAHDFNNMIGAILGWAELGYEESASGTTTQERFGKIREQSLRAAKLTSQLLAFGRQQILQPRNVNLNVFIQEEMSFLEKVIGEHIAIRVVTDPHLMITHADPTQLQQVIMNLCLNARDAMPGGGQLTIETRNVEIGEDFVREHPQARPGKYVAWTVSDTGIGMDHATAEHVFEPFFTTKEIGKGTGLGLATVYGIVKQHRGFIYVNSQPEHGSSFQIYLPADAGMHEPRETTGTEEIIGGTETILLAEDHDALREAIEEALQSLGYRVITASEGEEAVELYARIGGRIDLIVMDVVMPKRSGVDAYLKISDLDPGAKVIFTGGYANESKSLVALIEKGAAFLQKPYKLQQLSQMIRNVLDRRQLA